MKFALKEKYPIDTKDQLIKAAEFFDSNLSKIHPDDRVEVAINLDKQASELKVNLNKPWITNYTRMEKSAELSPSFKNSMQLRKEACIRNKVKLPETNDGDVIDASGIIDKIVKTSEDYSAKDLLYTIIEFDKRAGLEYLYDDQIMDPYITVFGDINNPEFDSVKLAGDSTQYDLIRASRDQEKLASIKDKFGEKFASEFQDNPIQSLSLLKSPERNVLSVITR